MSKLEHALALAARGFKVFPIAVGAKSPPLLSGWPKRATNDVAVVASMWAAVPEANIGIHCEDMIVVDVDVKKGGDASLDLLELTHGLPSTLTTRTPTGGRHLFFRSATSAPNSVSVLGTGLDIRSTGGYAVAPGSVVPAGAYVFEQEATAIADAPAWLVERVGPQAAKPASPAAPLAPAAPTILELAREWLLKAPRSVKGQGGDQTAYKVACGLRDMGVSEDQARVLMRSDAWDHGCGWRAGWLEAKPIHSAYRYATGEAGAKLAGPGDFPAEPAPAAPAGEPRRRLRRIDEVATQASRQDYVIKGFLQKGTYAEMFGQPGEGKSFTALDMSYCVAAGVEWMGNKVKGGPVLYLAYEGGGGLSLRAQALRYKYGKDPVPLYVSGEQINLRTPDGRGQLGALVKEMPVKPVLVVIDTFARALMGGDENSAKDVGEFNAGVAALIEWTGACVMIVHHSGKDKAKGARGSNALLGAIDTEIEIDSGRIISNKQRDLEAAQPVPFRLKPVMVGIDEDGDEITSCIVAEAAAAAPQSASMPGIAGNNRRGFDVLCELAPDNAWISQDEWRAACLGFLSPTRKGKDFWDIVHRLKKLGYIVVDKDKVQRKMQ